MSCCAYMVFMMLISVLVSTASFLRTVAESQEQEYIHINTSSQSTNQIQFNPIQSHSIPSYSHDQPKLRNKKYENVSLCCPAFIMHFIYFSPSNQLSRIPYLDLRVRTLKRGRGCGVYCHRIVGGLEGDACMVWHGMLGMGVGRMSDWGNE